LYKKQLNTLYQYEAFGQKVESELELPELYPGTFNEPDVKIYWGKNPLQLEKVKDSGVLFQASPEEFLFRLDSVASYYVTNGKTIRIERLSSSTDEEVRLFLLGSAFGALLQQKGLLPFHGSTVVKEGKGIIIGGSSGSGKSSLAANLISKNYKLLSDDISVIQSTDNGLLIYPGIPHLKLWHDIMLHLNIEPDKYDLVRPQILKYKKTVNKKFYNKPVVPGKIIILKAKNSEGITTKLLQGIQKFNALKDNTYRVQFIEGLDKIERHFRLISQLAGTVPVYEVNRPFSPILLDELTDIIDRL